MSAIVVPIRPGVAVLPRRGSRGLTPDAARLGRKWARLVEYRPFAGQVVEDLLDHMLAEFERRGIGGKR